jgi:hypothetical protein
LLDTRTATFRPLKNYQRKHKRVFGSSSRYLSARNRTIGLCFRARAQLMGSYS